MATVKLRCSELRDLPPVCARCGAAATEFKDEAFAWTPQWAQFTVFLGLLPWLVLVALTRRTATVRLPYCAAHAKHRPPITKVVWVGLAVGGLLLGFGVCADRWALPVSSDNLLMAGLATVGVTVLVVLFGSDGRARATHITVTAVTLDRVSEEFAEAVRSGSTPARACSGRGGMELLTAKYYRGR